MKGASIVELKKGERYRVFVDEGKDPATGKRLRYSRTVQGTREDAEALVAIRRVALGSAQSATYGQLFAAFVEPELQTLAAHTVEEYRHAWAYLQPIIGDLDASKPDRRFAERVIRGAGAPSNQRKVLRFWRKLANRAMREGFADRNPIDRYIKTDAEPKRAKRLLEADEVMPWMQAVRGIKYEPVLLCELGGGLSPEEACALRCEDVSAWGYRGRSYALVKVEKALTVVSGRKVYKEPKNGFRVREAVIGEPFAARILELCGGCGALVPSGAEGIAPEDAYTSPQTITRNWRLWCERHDVPYVSQANMRSTFATLHGEAGSPDSVVSGAMGHSGRTTKSIHYQRVTRRALAGIADNLAEYLAECGA